MKLPAAIDDYALFVLIEGAADAALVSVRPLQDRNVRLAVKGRTPVEFYGRMGAVVPFTEKILHEIERIASSKLSVETDPRDAWLERMAQIV